MFVLDCSVTMSWCFQDEQADNNYAAQILSSLESDSALVPRLWHLEVLNVLLVAERQRRITAEQSDTFLQSLSTLPIETDPMPVTIQDKEVIALARKYQLSAYHTAYLALAIGEDLKIATQNRRLGAAARALKILI